MYLFCAEEGYLMNMKNFVFLSFSQSMSVELHIKDNDLISTNFSNEKIRKRSLLTIDNYEDQSRYCLFKQTDFGNDSHSSIIQLKKKKTPLVCEFRVRMIPVHARSSIQSEQSSFSILINHVFFFIGIDVSNDWLKRHVEMKLLISFDYYDLIVIIGSSEGNCIIFCSQSIKQISRTLLLTNGYLSKRKIHVCV